MSRIFLEVEQKVDICDVQIPITLLFSSLYYYNHGTFLNREMVAEESVLNDRHTRMSTNQRRRDVARKHIGRGCWRNDDGMEMR